VTVVPSWLGTYADGRFTAKHTGTGLIVANDGWAVGMPGPPSFAGPGFRR
jgi:hypothetical protein